MLTGGLGYSYNVTNPLPLTQTNLAAYPTASRLTAEPDCRHAERVRVA